MTDSTLCSCGTKRPYSDCCEPIIKGALPSPTAETPMRARSTAFARGEIDFLLSSHHTRTRAQVKRRELEDWSKRSTWTGLEILATEKGAETDDTGTVSFVARYKTGQNATEHREKAQFEREEAQWRFVDGGPITHAPVVRAGPKLGRNDPCHCGSGKKFKKCHGANDPG